MIHARVEYMDMRVKDVDSAGGGKHRSKKDEHCLAKFNDPKFVDELKAAAPELEALIRLYKIGVEVNHFQKKELEQCGGTEFSPPRESLVVAKEVEDQ